MKILLQIFNGVSWSRIFLHYVPRNYRDYV